MCAGDQRIAFDHGSITAAADWLDSVLGPESTSGDGSLPVARVQSELAGADLDGWRWMSEPVPLALDYEAVVFLDPGRLDPAGQPTRSIGPANSAAITFLMRLVEGRWLVQEARMHRPGAEAPPSGG